MFAVFRRESETTQTAVAPIYPRGNHMPPTLASISPATTFVQLCSHMAIQHENIVYSVKYSPDSDGFVSRLLFQDGTETTVSESTRELAACVCLAHIYGKPYCTVTKHYDAYVVCPAPGCGGELSISDHGEGPDADDPCRHFVEINECGAVFVFPKDEQIIPGDGVTVKADTTRPKES